MSFAGVVGRSPFNIARKLNRARGTGAMLIFHGSRQQHHQKHSRYNPVGKTGPFKSSNSSLSTFQLTHERHHRTKPVVEISPPSHPGAARKNKNRPSSTQQAPTPALFVPAGPQNYDYFFCLLYVMRVVVQCGIC